MNMQRIISILAIVVLIAIALMWLRNQEPPVLPGDNGAQAESTPDISVIAENLEIPWDLAFLPDGRMLVTERTGDVLLIDPQSTSSRKAIFTHDEQRGEGGLLGVVLHPDFSVNKFVYLYMTAPGTEGETTNRVVRYRFENDALVEDRVIIAGIPGAIYHDGGRMEFGPDERLYITTGDATRSQIAQDKNSLGGKILRLQDDGVIPTDNPFGNAVYSYGHRNPQGLAWDSEGRLWETEHGRSGITTGMDEINHIEEGGNYGWPDIEGDETQSGMIAPAAHSGANDTWAPASAIYYEGSLYFGGLRGEALYQAVLDGERVVEIKEHFKGQYGRIRTIRVGPDGMFYITTSNRDGRGDPTQGDDKIIRVNPEILN